MLWKIFLLLLSVLTHSGIHPFGYDSDDNAAFPPTYWDTTIDKIISTLERSTIDDPSALSDMLPLFSSTDTLYSTDTKGARLWIFRTVSDRAKRLLDTSSPAYRSLMADALGLLEILQTYRSYDKQIRLMFSPTAISAVRYRGVALESILTSCEIIYAKLISSPDTNQTFVLSVPLAFVHLSALREKSVTSSGSQQYEAGRNLTVWLATYWQFISDGYLSWKEWRISQIQVDRWVHATLIQNVCHVILWDKLFKRHLLNLQMESCNNPGQLDAHIASVVSQSSNQLEFEMMAIVSKIFILHKFIPGYEKLGPFPGNFSTLLQLGPIQPLTYRTLWKKTFQNDSAVFATTCQPTPPTAQRRGITNVTVQQGSWVEDIRVQYLKGTDRLQGKPAGGRVESLSFDPNSDRCLGSIMWRMSTFNHMVTHVMLESRSGEFVGSEMDIPWSRRTALETDVSMYTTAPLLYCITNVAICSPSFNRTSAVTSFQVVFDLQNVTQEMPVPLLNGLRIIKANPVFVLVQNGSNVQSSTQSSSVNRFIDALGLSVPLSVPKNYGSRISGQTNGKQSLITATDATVIPAARKSTPDPGGNQLANVGTMQLAATPSTHTLPGNKATTVPETVLQRSVRSPLTGSRYPFKIEDVIAVTAETSQERDRILQQDIMQLWNHTLGSNVSGLEVVMKADSAYLAQPINEGGKPIREVTYQISGEASVLVDTNTTLERFRSEAARADTANVYATADTNGILVPIRTRVRSAGNVTDQPLAASLDIFDFEFSDKQDEPYSATTVADFPTQTSFLLIRRRVRFEEQAEFAVLMAAAWAAANNRSVKEIDVNVTRMTPVISETGELSSNITYTVSGPELLKNPAYVGNRWDSLAVNSSISRAFSKTKWPILECHPLYYCFLSIFPAHRLFLTGFNNTNVDPTRIRSKIRKAVQLANSDLEGARIEVGFPAYTPPEPSQLITQDRKQLLEIIYFIAATNESAVFKRPSAEQIQTQFPGSSVYEDGDTRLRQPVTIFIQRRDNADAQITSGKPEKEKVTIQQEIEEIADQAVRNVASRLNVSCLGCTGLLVEITDLYGLFGRHLFKAVILPEKIGTIDPNNVFLAEITDELGKVINSSSERLSVASELERNITVTDPNKVYFRDFLYFPLLIRNYRREMVENLLSLNKDCDDLLYSSGNCGLEVLVLATESREATDGSNFTRVYYTITSESPYTRYPLPEDVNSRGYGSKVSSRLACATPRCLASTKNFCGWWDDLFVRYKNSETGTFLPICESWQFRCRSGKCINGRYKCDRDRDCDDSSDEEDCVANSTKPCLSTEFRCNNGQCVPLAWTCDGDRDCFDGSDETDFCEAVPCQYIQCACSSGRCTAIVSKCDSYDDCSANSNRTICIPAHTSTCKPQEFKCANGNGCIKQDYRCDGYPDCADGSDESNCPP